MHFHEICDTFVKNVTISLHVCKKCSIAWIGYSIIVKILIVVLYFWNVNFKILNITGEQLQCLTVPKLDFSQSKNLNRECSKKCHCYSEKRSETKTINITADQSHFFWRYKKRVCAKFKNAAQIFKNSNPTGQKWETLTLAIVHGTVLFRWI